MESIKFNKTEALAVIDYINSKLNSIPPKRDYSYVFELLTVFLQKNNYSCKIEYYFYLAGKFKVERFKFPKEVILWYEQFYSTLEKYKKYIDAENSKCKAYKDPDLELFYRSQVKLKARTVFSSENFNIEFWKSIVLEREYNDYIQMSNSRDEMLANLDEGYDEGNNFCEACQNSPCICSDRERTSTTFDS